MRLFKSASDGREVKVAVVESIGEGEQRCGLGVVRACTGSSLGGDGEEWGSVCRVDRRKSENRGIKSWKIEDFLGRWPTSGICSFKAHM